MDRATPSHSTRCRCFKPSLARRLVAANIRRIEGLTSLATRRGSSWWRAVPRIGAQPKGGSSAASRIGQGRSPGDRPAHSKASRRRCTHCAARAVQWRSSWRGWGSTARFRDIVLRWLQPNSAEACHLANWRCYAAPARSPALVARIATPRFAPAGGDP
ncbi:phage integrase family protein [Cupriavidus sp. L7L]|uniref:phage integrase family protein n=1 Tax=Cupriavidus sp. L7L TaxID=2546443 RepID=UPI001FB5A32C|nr:phage integrase family protein [Cupriavidus sp. L7L]